MQLQPIYNSLNEFIDNSPAFSYANSEEGNMPPECKDIFYNAIVRKLNELAEPQFKQFIKTYPQIVHVAFTNYGPYRPQSEYAHSTIYLIFITKFRWPANRYFNKVAFITDKYKVKSAYAGDWDELTIGDCLIDVSGSRNEDLYAKQIGDLLAAIGKINTQPNEGFFETKPETPEYVFDIIQAHQNLSRQNIVGTDIPSELWPLYDTYNPMSNTPTSEHKARFINAIHYAQDIMQDYKAMSELIQTLKQQSAHTWAKP